jgi:hypothetical protein
MWAATAAAAAADFLRASAELYKNSCLLLKVIISFLFLQLSTISKSTIKLQSVIAIIIHLRGSDRFTKILAVVYMLNSTASAKIIIICAFI